MKKVILFLAFITIATACGNNVDYIPKPRTYPRISYPEKAYKAFDENYCAFTFQQPVYTEVVQDAEFFGEEAENPCWFDLYYPAFNGKLHCNYVSIDEKNTLTKLVDDSYKLAFKHVSKASGIGEEGIYFPDKNVYGIFFPLEGSVASPYQFFVTDSVDHYMRGSLYFGSSPNPDSMAPVIQFVKEDIEKMLETFEWN